MKLLAILRQRLAWKLFLSYLVIILVGALILALTATLSEPDILGRHISYMQTVMGIASQAGAGQSGAALANNLRDNFVAAINEILLVATTVSVMTAVAVSLFTAKRIVGPLRDMTTVSRRIAAGSYHQRVQMPGEDELGTLAQSFNQMAETLEQTELRRMALIGDVAHELRTPLSSIRGTMEGLVDGVLPAEPSTFLDVQREVTRLQRLVHDLEELSRAEAGQIALDLHPGDLGALARAAADRLRVQFDDKGVCLQVDVASALPPVRMDASRITQVLVNLLGNALQYTPTSGSVMVRVWTGDHQAFVAVHDTGLGVSAEHLPHLFERFYRVDRSRSRAGGGSGIGLTISRYLVEAHGGRIWDESPGVGQGSTFTFALPEVMQHSKRAL